MSIYKTIDTSDHIDNDKFILYETLYLFIYDKKTYYYKSGVRLIHSEVQLDIIVY